MNVLRLRFQPDDDRLGELFVAVAASQFSGVSASRFSVDTLRGFAAAIAAFPLPAGDPPAIAGTGETDRMHVAIGFAPHDDQGAIRATIRLATGIPDQREHHLAQDVTTRFLVSHDNLAAFGASILDLLDGRAEEAVLSAPALW